METKIDTTEIDVALRNATELEAMDAIARWLKVTGLLNDVTDMMDNIKLND